MAENEKTLKPLPSHRGLFKIVDVKPAEKGAKIRFVLETHFDKDTWNHGGELLDKVVDTTLQVLPAPPSPKVEKDKQAGQERIPGT